MRKYLVLLLAFACSLPNVAFATVSGFRTSTTETADRLNISITANVAPEDSQMVTIKIVNPDGDDIHYNQFKVETEGQISDRMYLKKGSPDTEGSGDPSGTYSFYMYQSGSPQLMGTVDFVNSFDDKDVLVELNALTTPQQMLEFLADPPATMQIDKERINQSPDKNGVANALLGETFVSANHFINSYNLATALCKVNFAQRADMETALMDSALELELGAGSMYDLLGTSGKNFVLDTMVDQTFALLDKQKAQDVFRGVVNLSVANQLTASDRDEVFEIIENLSKLSGYISANDLTYYNGLGNTAKQEFVLRLLALRPFNNADDFRTKFNTATKPQGGGNGGGGNGGGGAGGGGGAISSTLTLPKTTPVPKEEEQSGNQEQPPLPLFSDLENGHWATEYITKLVEHGAVSGYPDGTFAPEKTITRAEFLKMILVAADITIGETGQLFDDVPDDAWFAPYVNTAKTLGIVNGIDQQNFGAESEITREQMMVIAFNVLNSKGLTSEAEQYLEPSFNDADSISDWAKKPIAFMEKLGVVSGAGDNMLNPKNNAKRAEAAKIIILISEM